MRRILKWGEGKEEVGWGERERSGGVGGGPGGHSKRAIFTLASAKLRSRRAKSLFAQGVTGNTNLLM